MANRRIESRKAARILRRILSLTKPNEVDRRWALELAISLLEARAFDAMEDD